MNNANTNNIGKSKGYTQIQGVRSLCFLSVALFVLAIATLSCKNDVINSGMSVLPQGDYIDVTVDTFGMSSVLREAGSMISAPDSLLLGEVDNRYGTIHADILTQVTCPEGYSYPEGAEVDSVCIFLTYNSWFGNGTSPMAINIYEMDNATFAFSQPYMSDLDLSDYWSGDEDTQILPEEKIVVAAHPTDSSYISDDEGYQYYIRCRTSDDFAKRFFAINDFSSQQSFNDNFKGLYITSTFGSSTILHVQEISLAVYYHFTYQKADRDTTISTFKGFYGNRETRRVNRIEYINGTYEQLLTNPDTNFIVSPANLYTRLSIPMEEMSEKIKNGLGDKRPYVNLAQLYIEVLNVYTGQTSEKTRDDWAQPANYMMLIKENAFERFFEKREVPSDTCAIISSLKSGSDTDGNTVYYYSYDLATLLTRQLRNKQESDTLNMVLVPVSVTTGSTGSSNSSVIYTSAKLLNTITATVIPSAKNSVYQFELEVVCSGF